eukprot:TRINITY_DN8562_c0_g1_i2.p1 TRINITY_DN8562_c0_g1~~TRINITY_DN8562_c0_g1_i2.p1  ORF type:complete len:449 (+),score=52.32 TRINITY_DN8562_c0_g1_i2:102-1349(+)
MLCCAAREDRYEGWSKFPLDNDWEASWIMLMFPPVATIDFYKGTSPLDYLTTRLTLILSVNPWLDGRLVKEKESGLVVLMVPPNPKASRCIVQKEDVGITCGMSYDALYDIVVAQGNVKTGREVLDKDRPLMQLTVFPAGADTWAVMVSINHTIVDGHTFYEVHNMLGDGSDVIALDRKTLHTEVLAKARGLTGPKKSADLRDPGVLMATLMRGLWEEKPPSPLTKYVDKGWLDTQKRAWKGKETDFVSTNDVVTSWFFKASEAQYGWMAINWRNRLTGLDNIAAGNYEGLLLYHADEIDTPAKVRQSISRGEGKIYGGERDEPPIESIFRQNRIGVTNWATFYKDLTIPGCSHQMSMPIFDRSIISCGSIMIIFKANAVTTACYCFSRSFSIMSKLGKDPALGSDVRIGEAPAA